MKGAKQIIDLVGSYPDAEFSIKHFTNLLPGNRSAARRQAIRVTDQLVEIGFLVVSTMPNGYRVYRRSHSE